MTAQEIMIPQQSQIARLDNLTTLKPFLETGKGQGALAKMERREKNTKILKIVLILVALSITAYLGYVSGISMGLTALVGYGLITYAIYQAYKRLFLNPAIDGFYDKRWQYTLKVAEDVYPMLGSYYYAFFSGHIFFFNDAGCAYVDTENGNWIQIDKADIKRVNIEHVNLGSTTVSSSVTTGTAYAVTDRTASFSGRTNTTSNTTQHYEWRLDVMSGFVEYPNLTIVFDDSAEGEDSAKKAAALLSP